MERHECGDTSPEWPVSNWSCTEHEDRLELSANGEYSIQVNFCPFCGYKAKIQKEEND